MELKDVLSLMVSGAALFLSLFATWRATRTKVYEDRRLARTQLTETMARFSANDLENAKLFREYGQKDPIYYQNASSILNASNVQMIQQARFWMAAVPDLVTPADYATLAWACNNAWALLTAEEMQKKAIESSPQGHQRAMMLRSYAVMMFNRGRYQEGRDAFGKATTCITSTDDAAHFTNGLTHQIWGSQEMNAGRADLAHGQFGEAQAEFERIDSRHLRDNALASLQAARQGGTATGLPIPAVTPTRDPA